ncbi:hypothetical protein [Hoeflea sp. TYP-13]|uniref:hypothetical protein n=1 Tax=Hoeflea sp. TYP-13 TaxID=3230023 RepID=UPI0034C681EA
MKFSDKVDFLKDPSSYPGTTNKVRVRETHTAMVFLTDERVYKMKKPVRFAYLDATRLDSREHLCREEYRLNSQLSANTYLGVTPLRLDNDGRFALNGSGKIVDWLVVMERLPEAQFLSNRITGNDVSRTEITELAAYLSDFYRRQRRNPVLTPIYANHLIRESRVNEQHLTAMRAELNCSSIDAVLKASHTQLHKNMPEIKDRICEGLIVEGHGDLRPEHVCLVSPPVLFDRLEFDPNMLAIDIYDEVNYLGLECRQAGAEWIGPLLLHLVEERIGDAPSPGLLETYSVFRLLLRARLAIDHLLDPNPEKPKMWIEQSLSYVRAATAVLRLDGKTAKLSIPISDNSR